MEKRETFHECTDVTMVSMSEQEIADYVASGDPLDKAGAYGIQGKFAGPQQSAFLLRLYPLSRLRSILAHCGCRHRRDFLPAIPGSHRISQRYVSDHSQECHGMILKYRPFQGVRFFSWPLPIRKCPMGLPSFF